MLKTEDVFESNVMFCRIRLKKSQQKKEKKESEGKTSNRLFTTSWSQVWEVFLIISFGISDTMVRLDAVEGQAKGQNLGLDPCICPLLHSEEKHMNWKTCVRL